MSPGRTISYTRAFWVFLLGLTLLRGIFAASCDLSPDEAYYWAWSTDLDLGYYDHGPLVAWLIALGTAVLGTCALAVRLGALLCSIATTWILFVIGRDLTSSTKQAFWMAVMLSVSPVFSVGAIVHTPDAALSLSWSLAIWFGIRALRYERITDWIGLGFSIGVAILSKMTGVLLLLGLGLFLCLCKAGRQRMKSPGPALAFLLAVAVALPNLIWNSQHGGGSFAFQFQHATGSLALAPLEFLAFLGGQAGVVSPLLWVGMVMFMAVGWQRSIRFGRSEVFFMWCCSAPVLLLFLLLSLVHKVEANWPVMAYLAALPCAVWIWQGGRWYLRRIKLWTTLALLCAAIPTLLIHLQVLVPFIPLDQARDPTARLRGWHALADQAVSEADKLGARLASEGYGPVSELRFYSGREVLYEPSSSRISQYDLWDQKQPLPPILFLQPRSTQYLPNICAGMPDRWELVKRSDQVARLNDFRWWVCIGAD